MKFEITAAMARLGDPHAQDIIASLAISKFAEDQWNAMAICPELPSDLAANALSPRIAGTGQHAGGAAGFDHAPAAGCRALARADALHPGRKVAIDNLKNANPNLRASPRLRWASSSRRSRTRPWSPCWMMPMPG